MKVLAYIFLFILLAGCGYQSKPAASQKKDTAKKVVASKKFHEFRLNNDYTTIDTGTYDTEGPMTGGSYAIIKRNGVIADTIDLSLGLMDLGNDTYLYQKLSPDIDPSIKLPPKELLLAQGDYFIVEKGVKSKLKDVLPDFDDYYSSPNAIKGHIYYWQLKTIDTVGTQKVSAAEYDPITSLTKSHYLTNTVLETDDAYYLNLPRLDKDSVVYEIDETQKWKFSITQGVK